MSGRSPLQQTFYISSASKRFLTRKDEVMGFITSLDFLTPTPSSSFPATQMTIKIYSLCRMGSRIVNIGTSTVLVSLLSLWTQHVNFYSFHCNFFYICPDWVCSLCSYIRKDMQICDPRGSVWDFVQSPSRGKRLSPGREWCHHVSMQNWSARVRH